jgi:cob(I)alamin adenosyltransferase
VNATGYGANTLMARVMARKLERERLTVAADGSLAAVAAELLAYFDQLNDLYFPQTDRLDNILHYGGDK